MQLVTICHAKTVLYTEQSFTQALTLKPVNHISQDERVRYSPVAK